MWRLRWRTALARGRLFLWNVAIPLTLLAPVALSPAAAPHRAAVYAVVVGLFGTFGACIPLLREGGSGWTEKVLLTGYPPRRWLAERSGAEVVLDGLQLLPALGILGLAEGAGPAEAVGLVAAALLALLAANLIGAVAAAAVRSLAEGALASAVLGLVALHLAGVFRPPNPGWQATAARWSPFRPLHESLLGLGSPSPAGAPLAERWLLPVSACGLLLASILAAAPLVGRRLSSPERTD